ncbi:hypothetical protein AX14_004941 [Amanita brunnescens Koide BX004]|nr:hypothetical protein AX14_004941 [Amanita brunnescens Koide BX004]
MPPELLARIPVGALEKLPDDLLAGLPRHTLQAAPASFLERLPIDVFSRMSDSMIVTLPNNLSCVPSRLLDIALERMQRLLDQQNNPDRDCAVRLLHQLPKTRLEQLAQSYISMRDDEPFDEANFSTKAQVIVDDDQADQGATQVRCRLSKISLIGFLIRVLPIPVLRRVLPFILNFQSSLKSIPTSTLARIPPEHMVELSTRVLDKLPEELLSNLPESLRMRPQSLQERLSKVLVQRIPQGLLDHLPGD